jgi:hypothetical protein
MNKNLKIGLIVAGIGVGAYIIYNMFKKKVSTTSPILTTITQAQIDSQDNAAAADLLKLQSKLGSTKAQCQANGYDWSDSLNLCVGS